MNRNLFERRKRQFSNLANRVNQLLITREWEKLSASYQTSLIRKLNSLFQQLCHYFSALELKKILAAAAIFIAFPLVSWSQSFAPPQQNPFGYIPPDVDMISPAFADIDNDMDFDLFLGDYNGIVHFYENTGTVNGPSFGPRQQNPFGIIPSSELAFPALTDIDGDGDLDLFIGGYYGNIYFYENTGTPASPAFAAPQQNPFGLTPGNYFAIPAFADIDDDGDQDLLIGELYGAMKFYENTGTNTQPAFAPPVQNPFGLTSAFTFGAPAFADIDHDGDQDLFVGEYLGNTRYFQNTGTASEPAFAPPVTNPFGIVQTYYYSFPAFADLDDDGDQDLMIGEYYAALQYFENTEFNVGAPEFHQEALFELYPNPATNDVFITLNINIPVDPWKVTILNLQGRIIKQEIIHARKLKLNTADLSPGVYFVRLVKEDKALSRKLVIR